MRRLALMPLVVLLALTLGARCYEPDTRVVVFIQGLYTTYDAASGRTQSSFVEDPRFTTLKDAFEARGYARADLVDYSYAGGEVTQSGAWRPASYGCALTDRAAEESLAVLETMLRDYRDEHDGVHFTLVGHSLGGYIAYQEAVRESARSDGDKLDIDVVLTFDAPLLGVDADKKAIIDQIPCEKTYIAGARFVADKQDAGLHVKRAGETARIAEAGIRLATFGNVNDCLWNTGHCLPGGGWIDDSGTQFLEGAAARFIYAVDANPFASHDAILAHEPAVTDAITFTGAP